MDVDEEFVDEVEDVDVPGRDKTVGRSERAPRSLRDGRCSILRLSPVVTKNDWRKERGRVCRPLINSSQVLLIPGESEI